MVGAGSVYTKQVEPDFKLLIWDLRVVLWICSNINQGGESIMIILYLRSKKCYDTIYFCLCHVCINLCSLHNAQCLLPALSIRVLRKTWLSLFKKTKDWLTICTAFRPTSLTMIIHKDTKNVFMCDLYINLLGLIDLDASLIHPQFYLWFCLCISFKVWNWRWSAWGGCNRHIIWQSNMIWPHY